MQVIGGEGRSSSWAMTERDAEGWLVNNSSNEPRSIGIKWFPKSIVGKCRRLSKVSEDRMVGMSRVKNGKKRWKRTVRRTKVVKLKGWVCCNGQRKWGDLL